MAYPSVDDGQRIYKRAELQPIPEFIYRRGFPLPNPDDSAITCPWEDSIPYQDDFNGLRGVHGEFKAD